MKIEMTPAELAQFALDQRDIGRREATAEPVPLAAALIAESTSKPRQAVRDGDALAGLFQCDCNRSAAWVCEHCNRGGYSFPDYGLRLTASDIAKLLRERLGLGELMANGVAALLDTETYVLRETKP